MHEYIMGHKSGCRQAEWVNISHETFCVHYPVRLVVTEPLETPVQVQLESHIKSYWDSN